MGHKYAKDLSLEDAKKATTHITEVITGFLCSVEQVFPKQGYGDLAKNIANLNNRIQGCSGPFLKDQDIDLYINLLLDPFTHMNPDVEKNLQDLFEAYKEISDFLAKNNTNIEFKLLDFEYAKINKMKSNVMDSNLILATLKQNNFKDIVALRALFSSFSSTVETTERQFLDELISYRDRINQFAKNANGSYSFPHDPVAIYGIKGTVNRNNGKTYTRQRALRHLIDHDHFNIDATKDPIEIHFQSPNDPAWTFQFDEVYTAEEFFNYVAAVDLFYKTAVCLIFTLMLNAVLRQRFKK